EREAKIANASLFEGYLWVLGAILLFIIALSSLPFLWWLIFPAAGLGSRGTRGIARHTRFTRPLEQTPQQQPAAAQTGAPPDGPARPPTATCSALTRRERERRKFLSPEEDGRLTTERAALQKRIDAETDEVTKMRLGSALGALDQQREQRAELSRAAARFD